MKRLLTILSLTFIATSVLAAGRIEHAHATLGFFINVILGLLPVIILVGLLVGIFTATKKQQSKMNSVIEREKEHFETAKQQFEIAKQQNDRIIELLEKLVEQQAPKD